MKALDELMTLAKWKDAFDDKMKAVTATTLHNLGALSVMRGVSLPKALKEGDPATILRALAAVRQTLTDASIAVDGMISYLAIMLDAGDAKKLAGDLAIPEETEDKERLPAPEIPVTDFGADDPEEGEIDGDFPGAEPAVVATEEEEEGDEPAITDDDLKDAGLA